VKCVRTVFFGTPALAVPALRALAETTTVVGVVCQPDRPAGRGLELSEPPVKTAARDLGLEVHQPVRVKTGNLHEWLFERGADAAIVLAYGRILPPDVLAAPKRGCLNLHASLLPKYRGAAPINWAIIRGEKESGISLMHMDVGVDTGPVYCMRSLPILPEDDAGSLTQRMAELCAVVVREDLPSVLEGRIQAQRQDEASATLAPPITREMTRLDWTEPAERVVNWVRGLGPRPGASTSIRGKGLKVLVAEALMQGAAAPPGRVVRADPGGLVVAAGSGSVSILRAQLEGRRALDTADLVNGRAVRLGDDLGV
jgi:methionyl-tRNA formyltransferase